MNDEKLGDDGLTDAERKAFAESYMNGPGKRGTWLTPDDEAAMLERLEEVKARKSV